MTARRVRPPSAGRWWVAVIAVIALLAGLPLAVGLLGQDSESEASRLATSRAGSEDLGRDEPPLQLEPPPFSYAITYRVESTADDRATVSTEQLQVRRPFDTRFTARSGAPPGRQIVSERVTRLGTLGLDTDGQPRTFALGPTIAGSDLRPEISVAEAANADLIERREQRQVAGRTCQVWRFGGPVTAGDLAPHRQGGSEWADACLDAAGLLLEEVWVQDGVRLRRKVAERVEIDLELADERFTLPGEQPVSFAQGNGYFRAIDPDSGFEGDDWVLPDVPSGFEYVGRFAYAAPQLDPYRDPASSDPRSSVSTADVWTRGPDLLVLEQGVVSGEAGSLGTHPRGREVDLGPLGRGQAVLDLRMNEARTQFEDSGRQVRVYGTLPVGEIIELAQSVTTRTSTGLRFLDGEDPTAG